MTESNDPQPETNVVARIIELAGYPAAAAATFFVGRSSVRKNVYKNLASNGIFDDLQAQRKSDIKALGARIATDSSVHGPTEIEGIHARYREAVKERFESWKFKGLKDHWRGLHSNQKIECLAFAAGTSAILLGACLTIAEHMREADKIALQKNRADKERQLD